MRNSQKGLSKIFSFIILAIVAVAVILLYQYWLMDLEIEIGLWKQIRTPIVAVKEQEDNDSVSESADEPEQVNMEVWIDNQSYNLSAGTFEAIVRETKEDAQVKVNSSTRFYRLADADVSTNREYFDNFVEFYVVAKDIYNWPFTVKGTFYHQEQGINFIVADEVFWTTQ